MTSARKTVVSVLAVAGHALLSLVAGQPAQAQMTHAPDFTLQAALGGKDISFSLSQALKRGPVVVFFYPKSFTSVCTQEAHLFAEAMDEFEKHGASVIGISADNIETQRQFSASECRDRFPVAADSDMKVIKAYQVTFGGLGAVLPFSDRVSFVIAPDGRILSRVKSGDASPHVEKSLEAVKAFAAKKS